MEDGLADPSGIDFKGKTVADLGCNLGYFSFQAHGEGALQVDGYDKENDIIQAANSLSQLKQTPGVCFFCRDIQAPPPRTYDIAMLLDIIGKTALVKGELNPLLTGLARYSSQMLVISARQSYRIKNDLGTTVEALAKWYGHRDIQENRFRLMDHIARHFSDQWQMLPLFDQDRAKPEHAKVVARFVPKKPGNPPR
jgi:ribosomal protein L11 methyltransferase